MSKQDTSLDDISQSITDLGTMIDTRFNGVEGRLSGVEGRLEDVVKDVNRQAVLLEDAVNKFDKNIDLLTAEMSLKKQLDKHGVQIGGLETKQKLLIATVTTHSKQLAR